MDKSSELECYLYFMWNVWNKNICFKLFDKYMGNHLWNKWITYCECSGATGAAAIFYAECDVKLRKFLKSLSYCYFNQDNYYVIYQNDNYPEIDEDGNILVYKSFQKLIESIDYYNTKAIKQYKI